MTRMDLRYRHKQEGNIEVVIIIVLIIGLVGFIGWYWFMHHQTTASVNSSKSSNTTSMESPQLSPAAQPLSAGADNASLDTDLSNVTTSLNQDNQNASAASTAVNDQQNQVQVPTQ